MVREKPIPGFPGYFVRDDGSVRMKRGHLSFGNQSKSNGYMKINLMQNGTRRYSTMHRLVANAFVENPRPDIFNCVDHIDGCKTHNWFSNLRWRKLMPICMKTKPTISSKRCTKFFNKKIFHKIKITKFQFFS